MNIDSPYILAGWVSQPRRSIIHGEGNLLAFFYILVVVTRLLQDPPPYVRDLESELNCKLHIPPPHSH